MTVQTPDERSADVLACALSRIVADPLRSDLLYPIFGQFCHDVRNLLNSIHMSFYLARRPAGNECVAPEVWASLELAFNSVVRLIDRFQHACKPLVLSPVRLPLSAFFEDRRACWTERLAARGKQLVLGAPSAPEASGLFDPMRLTLGLDDLVAWRTAVGKPTDDLRVQWSVDGGEFLVTWDEPRARPVCSQPPVAPSTSWETQTLDAFALPLLTRIMTSHGGSLETNGSLPDRWLLTMRWPLEARPTPRETTPCLASHPTR